MSEPEPPVGPDLTQGVPIKAVPDKDVLAGQMGEDKVLLARVEGKIAAANILGPNEPIAEPPFFWNAHYGVSIRYVGHAESGDRIEVDGDLKAKDAELRYIKDGETLAITNVGRDMDALKANEAMRDRAKG